MIALAAIAALLLVCTGMVHQLRRDTRPPARHATGAPIYVQPEPGPMPQPEQVTTFDPLTSPIDEVERFLAALAAEEDTRELAAA